MVSKNSGIATLFMVIINHHHFLAIKVMHNFLPVSLGLLLVLSNWSILPADAGRSRPICSSTLKSVRSSLRGVRSFKLNPLNKQGQPAGRMKSLDIVSLDDSFEISKQLSIATRIIKNCSQVGLVTYSVYRTDGGSLFGLVNGQVIEFPCQEDQRQPARWGENLCR
jgi:hypothetical protein